MIQILNKNGATNSDDANVIILDKNGNVRKIGGETTFINRCFGAVFDGGGSVILQNTTVDVIMPFSMTINEWTIISDNIGSVNIGIWKNTYSNYPPTIIDSITGTSQPNIVSSNKNQSVILTGWTNIVNDGDIIRFNIDSISSITKLTISITGTEI